MVIPSEERRRGPRAPMRPWLARLPLAFAALLAGTIFVVDTATDLEIAIAVFYVIVVLICATQLDRRGLLLVAGACMALTLISHLMTQSGAREAGLINGAISLTAIAATTYLALRMRAAQSLAHDARAQLLQVARVSALGELTATIAHEVNQPLAGLSAHGAASIRWLDADPPNLAEARASCQRIVDDAQRASAIVQRVRNLMRRAPPMPAPTDADEAIRDVLGLVGGELQQNRITARLNLDAALPPVMADRVQLEQVILNLVLNAIDAMASPNDARDLVISALKEQSNLIRVSVADTGAGADPQSFERLFDPFYTTKTNGAGLGLTLCRSIIEAYGGRIWAVANAPRGLIVHFTLPVESEESQ
jgi:C4-dicarboxylate-specific signal transduction histidine kinase